MSALTLVCLSGQGPAGSPLGLMLISIPCVADEGGRLTSAVRLVINRQAAPAATRESVVLNFRCMVPPNKGMPRRNESFHRRVERAFSRQRRLSSRRVFSSGAKTCPLESDHGRMKARSTPYSDVLRKRRLVGDDVTNPGRTGALEGAHGKRFPHRADDHAADGLAGSTHLESVTHLDAGFRAHVHRENARIHVRDQSVDFDARILLH